MLRTHNLLVINDFAEIIFSLGSCCTHGLHKSLGTCIYIVKLDLRSITPLLKVMFSSHLILLCSCITLVLTSSVMPLVDVSPPPAKSVFLNSAYIKTVSACM